MLSEVSLVTKQRYGNEVMGSGNLAETESFRNVTLHERTLMKWNLAVKKPCMNGNLKEWNLAVKEPCRNGTLQE